MPTQNAVCEFLAKKKFTDIKPQANSFFFYCVNISLYVHYPIVVHVQAGSIYNIHRISSDIAHTYRNLRIFPPSHTTLVIKY